MAFLDRVDAGRRLARRLAGFEGGDITVLGLPRGGVPVAREVASALRAPLDVIVVRKLGVPFQPELAMGAIGEDGVRFVNHALMRHVGVSAKELAAVEARERSELERRARRFRGDRRRVDLSGRTALIVDDGVATGSTARAACKVARALGAARVVLAVPVAPPGWEARIGNDADDCIALETPEHFFAIGQFYADFTETTDAEVVACLEGRKGTPGETLGQTTSRGTIRRDEEVTLVAGPVELRGRLSLPKDPAGVIVFAHGSGSSRHSPRNRYVASVLNDAGLGTLLFDLLTPAEEHDRANVFDVQLLGRRLIEVKRWLPQAGLGHLPTGYFGASTGAAAALFAASEPEGDVAAVVSRGGRPDLAADRLSAVRAPTLLIVGGRDDIVLELNRQAQARLRCENRLAVVPGATHLFEEAGALQAVATLASDWFVSHLGERAKKAS